MTRAAMSVSIPSWPLALQRIANVDHQRRSQPLDFHEEQHRVRLVAGHFSWKRWLIIVWSHMAVKKVGN